MENKNLKETVDEVVEEVKEEKDDLVEDLKEDLAELAEVAKKVGKKAKEVGTTKGKAAAKKVKASAEKVTKELKDMFTNTEVKTVLQVSGKEINVEEVVDRVKDAYRAENPEGKEVKTLNLYVKPEDNAVYYVVNDSAAGRIDL